MKFEVLNQMFSNQTLRALVQNHSYIKIDEAYSEFIQDNTHKSSLEKLKALYKVLQKKYRNEYYFKNMLLNKLLLGKHSVHTTTALSEMPIGKSIADFILINKKAEVYEIKTALDSLNRLEQQIEDYYKVFNHVSIVTDQSHVEKIKKHYSNSSVGIYVLTKRNTLHEVQKSTPYFENLDIESMYKFLRKPERTKVLKALNLSLPAYTDFTEYKVLLEVFKRCDIFDVYNLMLKQLKKRNRFQKFEKEFLESPKELKYLLYFNKLNHKETQKLYELMKEDEGCTIHI
ncbi:sce7726 family protein [Staphylococcus sp. EZ-P03]|uniref:sce7726 family protein n=1 Tax=Staphylococcus sp. EZ-P03 TaxID=2282739 RepID=UPI000DF827E1|nr:sce7726 family protein [Staphylococcus sp. EZ-P03]